MSRSLVRLLTCALALLCGVGASRANWYQDYLTPHVYEAGFTVVPDIDQRRDDLGNDGAMYCAPTAAFNWMAYIAHHGYPFIRPFNHPLAYWHSAAAYDEVTSWLLDMGARMDTDPIDGTGGAGSKAGLQSWLDSTGSGYFFSLHTHWIGNGPVAPSFDEIADWVNQGVPVAGVVGWYDDDGFFIVRDGGHVFSVTGVERLGDQRWLTFHDPADDTDLDEQSAPRARRFAIERRVRNVGGLVRVVDKVVDYGSGYIDNYTAIRPIMGLAVSSNAGSIVLVKPWRFSFDPSPLLDDYASPQGAPIADLAIAPHAVHSYLVTAAIPGGPSSKLWRFDPLLREFAELAGLGEGKAVEVDRFGRIHVLDGRTVRTFELDPDDIPQQVASTLLPEPCRALAIDDVNDRLLALCDGSVRPYDVNGLAALPAVQIPAGVVLSGIASVAASPLDGAIFLTSELSPAIYRLDGQGGFRTIAANLLSRQRDLSVGDGDVITVINGASGLTRVFAPDPQSGEWVEEPDAPFAGLPIARGLTVARSRTNFDPDIHSGPAYRNVLPPEPATAVPGGESAPAVPSRSSIDGVAPNPFNPSTTIRLEVPRGEDVTVAIHDLRGRVVRTMWHGPLAAGRHELVWNGTDERGGVVPSGVYLVRLVTPQGVVQTVKITLTK